MNKARYTQEVPEDRRDILRILENHKKPVKVMILGGVDSGKTTLATFLANELLSLGFKVAVIDSDIGQKGILPPATISLGFPDVLFESFGEIKACKHYFVGSITPNQFFGEMIAGVKILTEEAEKKADVIIIDTTGLISGPGVELKRMKIETVKPDILIALQRTNELEPILKLFEGKIQIFRLKVSDRAKKFNREERREIRKEKWREYFKDSKTYTIDLTQLIISGTQLFQGEEINENEKSLLEALFKWLIIHGRKIGEKYFVIKADVANISRQVDKNVLQYFDFEKLSNLVLGLIGRDGFCLGLGILKFINFRDMRAEILTPLDEETMKNVREIRFGRIRVREDGEELGLLDRNAL
ncbi:polyhydroxyalkanoate depolymerase [Thermococcus sp. M39]|uniref:Clp1/GlmU family protein n=1 Tax=Thermococcus sp. M39 TaxID=1638262 RepID=UPI00143C7E2D|nr:Clp1/GlmU family protein [Thermococcus sp. M39]NJE08984.1 polyhydroxyalkanoate depolymerase [Thermococcus sp. M39]